MLILKRIFKFIKKNFKLVIAFSLGFVLAGTSVYAANTIYSKNVTYDNSNSGLDATNVQDALDETYSKCIPPTAADDIINLYNNGSSINTVNIGGDTSNPQVKLNATQGIMLDNNGDYRYYGANPNNYVTFNDEIWRIIGVFHDVDDGTGKKETRLKIIRDEPIGKYSWDNKASGTGSSDSSSGSNDWSDSALQIVLNNGVYWNRTSGKCPYGQNGATTSCDFTSTGLTEEAKSMIGNAKWNLGGVSNLSNISSSFYTSERGTTVYAGRPTEWIGKIGLMYPSDYGYATSGGSTTNRETCLNTKLSSWSNYDDCFNNDWLYNSSNTQWTITPTSSNSRAVFAVNSSGRLNSTFAYSGSTVSPALYLSSNVKISGGEGTENSPYQLSL